jgi:hypothetical protein
MTDIKCQIRDRYVCRCVKISLRIHMFSRLTKSKPCQYPHADRKSLSVWTGLYSRSYSRALWHTTTWTYVHASYSSTSPSSSYTQHATTTFVANTRKPLCSPNTRINDLISNKKCVFGVALIQTSRMSSLICSSKPSCGVANSNRYCSSTHHVIKTQIINGKNSSRKETPSRSYHGAQTKYASGMRLNT